MGEGTRTVTVGEDGMIHISVPEFQPGTQVEVTIRILVEAEYPTADSSPDVEDFA